MEQTSIKNYIQLRRSDKLGEFNQHIRIDYRLFNHIYTLLYSSLPSPFAEYEDLFSKDVQTYDSPV